LSIPAIGVSGTLLSLGLKQTGGVQVPPNTAQAGWFNLGASPGQIGSAVILGHVDSHLGPGVFFRLRTLQPGDHVDVALADGVTTHFVVDSSATYLKSQFPSQQVYGSHNNSALQLVTCGGTFDTQTGHYLSNIVVYTSLVSTNLT
jgi:sortase (surface protein transpeptidase)